MTPSTCKVCGRSVTFLWISGVRVNGVTLWCWQCSDCWIEHARNIAKERP